MDYFIRTCEDLAAMVDEVGIVPFFRTRVPGWSVEEHVDRAVWFTGQEGPWEWKGQLAFEKRCVYGKFIRGRTAFVSPAWFRELANWRRGGCDFETRVEEGLVRRGDRLVMAYISAHPMSLSSEVKRGCGVPEGYDGALTRLEMQTYVVNADFRCSVDKHGRPYGWGNAVLCAADDWLEEKTVAPPAWTGEESLERIVAHLIGLMPEADEETLRRELK